MVELVKRYKVVIIVSILLLLNIGVVLFQSQSQSAEYVVMNNKQQEEGLDVEQISEVKKSSKIKEDSEVKVTSILSQPLVSSNPIVSASMEQQQTNASTQLVPVYICGAVRIPGVYYVANHAIINEVIQLCGGFLEEADQAAINLASPIVANEKIVVPKQGEEIDNLADTSANANKVEGSRVSKTENIVQTLLININTASVNELSTLPGIGEVKAQAIISYRETIKAFSSIDDIKNVSGIGDKTFEKLKSLITV